MKYLITGLAAALAMVASGASAQSEKPTVEFGIIYSGAEKVEFVDGRTNEVSAGLTPIASFEIPQGNGSAVTGSVAYSFERDVEYKAQGLQRASPAKIKGSFRMGFGYKMTIGQ